VAAATSFLHPPMERNMNDQQRKHWLPLLVLAGALILWAGMLALGAFLQLGDPQSPRRIAKPIVVLGAMCVFLALWGWALWLRSRRK
jgi:hypothetical protein